MINPSLRALLKLTTSSMTVGCSGWAIMAESGALFTYGLRVVDSYRRVGYFVDRIVRGAKPSDLPIEQPTVIELVVNLSSARRLGLIIPPAVLARSDRVIE